MVSATQRMAAIMFPWLGGFNMPPLLAATLWHACLVALSDPSHAVGKCVLGHWGGD